MITSPLPYVVAFGLTALACFAAIYRARQVSDPELRFGLTALLVTSGGWSVTHAAFFAFPGALKRPIYLFGLVLGFSTIWVWLYFCSAYTGRTYHRKSSFRYLAAGIYVAVVSVKVTNPLHHFYFDTAFTATPFPHLAIQQGVFHWAVTGFSYALAAAGIFMLLDLFVASDYDTKPLFALAALTLLPVSLDVVGYATPLLVDIIYAPLGVGAFAIGVLFVFKDRFLAVQATSEVDDPLVFLDEDDRIKDYNRPALRLFPALEDSTGEPLSAAIPPMDEAIDGGVLELTVDGDRRYLAVSTSAFGFGERNVGQVVMFSDVTTAERQRRELVRHNRQLEDFAGAMTHELRNSLQIIDWNVQAVADSVDGDDRIDKSLRTATSTAGRMSNLVDDFTVLARHGQTIEDTSAVDLATVANDALRQADVEGLSVSVPETATVQANPERLRVLLTSALEFADRNGASEVTVEPTDDGFAIADDGRPPGDMDPEKYFEYDEAVPTAKAGLKLPNVRSLARTHGWAVSLDETYDGGVRVVVSGARVERADFTSGGSEGVV